MFSLFISDLHLDNKRPDILRAFLHFLEHDAPQAEALYILGDLFEAWVGDDDNDPAVDEIRQALRAVSDSGTALYFQHGNRDFLIGQRFAEQTGATLLPEEYALDLYGTPTLLMHGDSLCTGDTEYIKFRETQARNPEWQAQLLAQPLAARKQLAQGMREQSQSANANKADNIMDVTPDEVVRVMDKHGAELLIHGHTHRPAIHEVDAKRQRMVLGDWDKKLWLIEASKKGIGLNQQLIIED